MVRLPGKLGMKVPNAGRVRHHSDEILHTRVNSGKPSCRLSTACTHAVKGHLFPVAVARREAMDVGRHAVW